MRQTRIKELHMLFHFSYLLRNTMSHFITNLSRYFIEYFLVIWWLLSRRVGRSFGSKLIRPKILMIFWSSIKNFNKKSLRLLWTPLKEKTFKWPSTISSALSTTSKILSWDSKNASTNTTINSCSIKVDKRWPKEASSCPNP